MVVLIDKCNILYRKYFVTFKINKLEILNILTWLSTGILWYILLSNGGLIWVLK